MDILQHSVEAFSAISGHEVYMYREPVPTWYRVEKNQEYIPYEY